MLPYHRVHEAVAAGIVRFHFIDSKENPSDIMTKAMDYNSAWPHIETLLFRFGDTLLKDELPHSQRGVSSGIGLTIPVSSTGASLDG